MKGIALEIIAYVIIAIVGLTILFMFFGWKVSPTIREVNCKFLKGLRGFLPIPEHLKPSLPAYCTAAPEIMEECLILSTNPERISFELAGRIIACWEKTGRIKLGRDKACYECYIKYTVDGVVTESMVKKYIEEYKLKDITRWKVGEIKGKTSVGILYNSSAKLIDVI